MPNANDVSRVRPQALPAEFKSSKSGFTLIELLVVIAVIAVLMGILMPVLARAKERGRRAACMGNVRQFIIGTTVYASDENERLPSGLSDADDPGDEHTPILSKAIHDRLVDIIGDQKVLSCPWLRDPFNDPNGWYYVYYGETYGYVIGYNYLGGHQGTPWPLADVGDRANTLWVSPLRTFDRASSPLITELNAWSESESKTFAPHGTRGAILMGGDTGNTDLEGIPSKEVGADGGHVGLLDGSVSWRHMADMRVYRGSRMWDEDGCFTAW
jgi:prepilin-type N-terminal cleavage/methylation domain-containing protein